MQEYVENKVHVLRTGKGTTQEELAERVGVSRQQILKAPDSWNKTRYRDEILKAIAE